MNTLKTLGFIILTSLFFSTSVVAHSDHKHGAKKEVSELKIKATVLSEVSRLVSKKKLEESWKKAEVKELVKKKFGARDEWVATLTNDQVSDKNKSTLYVFINLYGDFIAANFTGK